MCTAVWVHASEALSPFLFATVMDRLTDEVRHREAPWTMLFADDIVICSETKQQAEDNLDRWRYALERRGMKVSRSKTEYMCMNGSGNGKICLQKEELKKVNEFKYLGTTMVSNGEYSREVKNRIQAGWSSWRRVSAIICDKSASKSGRQSVQDSNETINVIWFGNGSIDKEAGSRVGSG